MPDTPLPPALDRDRAELLSAATRARHDGRAVRRRRRLSPRPLLLVAAGLLVAGTATAAIVVSTTTRKLDTNSRPDTPAVSNISGVVGAGGRVARTPLSGGTIKGLTVTRDGIHADVATNGINVCFADRAGETPTGSAGCGPLPIPTDAVPYQIGHDDTRTWVVAIVPDGTTDVTATGADGRRDIAQIANNVAIAILPGGSGGVPPVTGTTPHGQIVTEQPGKAPRVSDG
jgi:hypothetical protein